MESSRHQNNYHFLKMATKVLVPVSVFSIILSYSSLLSFFEYDFHFSAYTMQLFSCSLGKNYIFLLCNGILVLIVKNSGLVLKSPIETDFNGESSKKNGGNQGEVLRLKEMRASVAEENTALEVEEVEELENGFVKREEGILFIAEDEDEEQAKELLIIDDDEEEEKEDEGTGLLTIEELNRKCDEFIRKMKEGIKFEAQR